MKKAVLALILAVLIVLLAGCAVDHGTVLEKRFNEAHRTYTPYVMIISKKPHIMPR